MKHSKLILAAAFMLLSATTISAQKKKPAAASSGPIEMPKDTQVHIIPDEKEFRDMINQINEAIELKFDENYRNGDVFINLDGKPQLMCKAKCNADNADPQTGN